MGGRNIAVIVMLVVFNAWLLLSCVSNESVDNSVPRHGPPVDFNERVAQIKKDYEEKSSPGSKDPSQPTTLANPAIDPLTKQGLSAYVPEKQQPEPLKKLSIPKVGASESPRNDDIHDNENNAIVILQDPTFAMKDFPRDRRMQVDWVKALDQGKIEPRADLEGKTEMTTLDMDIVMKNTQFMPWVRFPHIAHTKWLACSNCHPKIFIPQENANPISMNKVLRGEYCGVCHDKVAFALFICERCHSVPHEGSGPKWW